MLRYTLMRFGIFVGCFLAVWGLASTGIVPRGAGSSYFLWIALLGLVISAPISYVVLRKERDRASVKIVERVDRTKANYERNRTQEDLADDAARAQSAS
ncbi:DUF4229 domain-containing protein [Streptomyces sp. NPDC055144]